MKNAVLYLRLSDTVDDSTAIARQEADLRAHAERNGWHVVRLLSDDGISGRKARANADECLRMLRDGEADVLAVWKFDRWSRAGLGAVAALVEVLDAVPGSHFVALQDGLNSGQPAWRIIASVLAEVARMEADNTAARIKSSITYRKTVTDKYTGGAAVPFGYRSVPAPDNVGRVLVPDAAEAAIVDEVAERLLSGVEPLSRIADDLQRRGVHTSKSPARRARNAGKPTDGLDAGIWRASTLRSLWSSDLLLGRVKHDGDLIRDASGLPRSVWPPLVDLATLEALRRRLGLSATSPRKPARKRKAARLLSGLAFCALCGAKMYVTSSSGKPIYGCGSSWNRDSDCPSPKIGAEALESHVAEAFLSIAGAAPEREEVELAEESITEAQLAEVEAALREASAAMIDDDADVVALGARIAELKARRAELKAAPAPAVSVTYRDTGRTLREAWDAEEDVDLLRRVLEGAVEHVEIASTTRRGSFDPSRAVIRWTS